MSATPEDRPGFELPLLLLAGFRTLIDELHAELARQGHPDCRPSHGFAMQAIGPSGAPATEVARRLGVSKQAAGKTIDRLVTLGYAERVDDPSDGRRKQVRLTLHGLDALKRSAEIFTTLRARWAAEVGPTRLADLEDALRAVATPAGLDTVSWLSGT